MDKQRYIFQGILFKTVINKFVIFALRNISMRFVRKKIVAFFLLINILVSSTGVSVLQHICGCHPETRISLLPGYVTSEPDCCCSGCGDSYPCSGDHHGCDISGENDCHDVRIYVREEILADHTFIRIIPIPLVFSLTMPYGLVQPGACPAKETSLAMSKGPPFPGHRRILLYHSLRLSDPDHVS